MTPIDYIILACMLVVGIGLLAPALYGLWLSFTR